jgi:hypothetical protein
MSVRLKTCQYDKAGMGRGLFPPFHLTWHTYCFSSAFEYLGEFQWYVMSVTFEQALLSGIVTIWPAAHDVSPQAVLQLRQSTLFPYSKGLRGVNRHASYEL